MAKPRTVTQNEPSGPMFSTWAKGDAMEKAKAIEKASRLAQSFDPIVRTHAYNTFENVVPNMSVRDNYTARDYYWFRKHEETPKRQKDIIKECMAAYRKIGIIRNTIDLMADFVCQGITVSHKNPNHDKFLKAWAEKVKMKERSERFVNLLLRAGNVVVRRTTAKVTPRRADKLQRTAAAPDIVNPEVQQTVQSYEIPWKYTFLNPCDVEVVGDEVSAFVGTSNYVLRIPDNFVRIARAGSDNQSSALLATLPPDLLAAIRAGAKYIPLPNDKTVVHHYKKDDWQIWADPIHYCILDDLIDYQKARLADRTALDAAASRIRVWTLGSLEHELMPNERAFIRLNNMLMALGAGGTIDIIWGPDLKVEELSTDTDKFLGSAKYEQTLRNIYSGLGIPSTLTGDSGSGFTNNYVSLKTLIERLNYARGILYDFWMSELRLIQQALSHKDPAFLLFDRISLTTDDAEKALLVQLADRDIISLESIQGRFDLIPELENLRIKREHKKRQAGKTPEKASPFHKTGNKQEMQKLALQRGLIRPEDVDVESSLDTKKILMQQAAPKPSPGAPGGRAKPKGQPSSGRPKGAGDSSKRKQKIVKPRSKAEFVSMVAWSKEAQREINDTLTPVYLKSIGKKNLRQLSNEESAVFEELKWGILCKLEPFTKVSEKVLETSLAENCEIPQETRQIYAATLIDFMSKVTAEPTIEETRNLQAVAHIVSITGETIHGEDSSDV